MSVAYDKLRLYAQTKQKTMTQLIEDWIDRLPVTEIGNSDAGLPANASLSNISLPHHPDG